LHLDDRVTLVRAKPFADTPQMTLVSAKVYRLFMRPKAQNGIFDMSFEFEFKNSMAAATNPGLLMARERRDIHFESVWRRM
jgi:hypothetical protein